MPRPVDTQARIACLRALPAGNGPSSGSYGAGVPPGSPSADGGHGSAFAAAVFLEIRRVDVAGCRRPRPSWRFTATSSLYLIGRCTAALLAASRAQAQSAVLTAQPRCSSRHVREHAAGAVESSTPAQRLSRMSPTLTRPSAVHAHCVWNRFSVPARGQLWWAATVLRLSHGLSGTEAGGLIPVVR